MHPAWKERLYHMNGSALEHVEALSLGDLLLPIHLFIPNQYSQEQWPCPSKIVAQQQME